MTENNPSCLKRVKKPPPNGNDREEICRMLNENSLRQIRLTECLRKIYIFRATMRIKENERKANKENRDPQDSRLKDMHKEANAVWLLWPKRRLRKNEPGKLKENANYERVMFFSGKSQRRSRRKLTRGYLKGAREAALHNLRLEKFKLNKFSQKFYANAKSLLFDILAMRERVRVFMKETLEYMKDEETGFFRRTDSDS